MGKALIDLSYHGKMKDHYPLEIFSSKNILKALEKNKWHFIFYSIPFNLMINAIRNQFLSHDLRKFILETSFYFILHYLYQYNESIAPPISRIGLIQIINTIVGSCVALERYDFVQMGHIGTHPLENYFSSLRISCHFDHSYCNIFRAIGKSILVKKLLDDLKQTNIIRTRLGYCGTHAKIECTDRIIPNNTPFQFFISIWNKMKDENADITIFESWFPCYKTTEWNDQILIASILSGSSIISRYLNLSDSKSSVKQRTINMKCRKKELI